jgi:hypothetical protein
MKKLFLSVLMTLLLTLTAFAEIEIPQDKRVKNYESGCCVWCAVENLSNVHGIDQLKGIAKHRHDNYYKKYWVEGSYVQDQWGRLTQIQGPHWSIQNEAPGTVERVEEEFKRLRVKYKLQRQDNYDTAILEESVKNKLGCAVGLKNYPNYGNYHMVTLTEITKDKFIFVDNNGECNREEKTRAWFDEHWSGYTIMVIPDKVIAPFIEEEEKGKD